MNVCTWTSTDPGNGTRKRVLRRKRFSVSHNSVPVHTNDDQSDEVFVCPETTKHKTAETRQ